MKLEFTPLNRREFVGFVSRTAALLGLTASAAAADQKDSNPFAYDISKLQKTDPKLITYAESKRWRCPRKDARQLAIAPDDRILVCAGNYISTFDSDGQPGLEIALPEPASCLGVGKDGTIHAGLRSYIQIYDANGQRRASWDSPDPKSWFTGIAVGENDVFVA